MMVFQNAMASGTTLEIQSLSDDPTFAELHCGSCHLFSSVQFGPYCFFFFPFLCALLGLL